MPESPSSSEAAKTSGSRPRFSARRLIANGGGPPVFRSALTLIVLLVAGAGLMVLVWFTFHIWSMLFIGILFAIFLVNLARHLRRWTHLRHPWAVMIVLLGLMAIGSAAGWLLAAPITQQFQALQQQLPRAADRFWEQIDKYNLRASLPKNIPSAREMMDAAGKLMPKLAGFFRVTIEAITGLLVAVFLGLYLALDPETYIGGVVRLVPRPNRARARALLHELGDTLSRWIFGQLLSMAVLGVLIGLGLNLIGIPFALALGMFAGIMDFIPIFGPIVAALPAVLLGFTLGPWHALYVVLIFVAANQLEGHVLLPFVHQYTVYLPSALTLFALTLLAGLFGVVGMLLATPLAAVCLVLVKRLYVEGLLGDRTEEQ